MCGSPNHFSLRVSLASKTDTHTYWIEHPVTIWALWLIVGPWLTHDWDEVLSQWMNEQTSVWASGLEPWLSRSARQCSNAVCVCVCVFILLQWCCFGHTLPHIAPNHLSTTRLGHVPTHTHIWPEFILSTSLHPASHSSHTGRSNS